ncbi:MAG: ATP-grasp domain-containing protein [Clostridia bacterium]|nr:ATP-grasp domain-containing protein [Clostridia bacterium]
MKNFVFISPNFPTHFSRFCRELAGNGLRVLGVGDQPYDELLPELKESLTEYYKVGSLENYDEVYRAVAYFCFRYGPVDWLESNNEYWLEQDARLRTAFHITSGWQIEDIPAIKFKSKMKACYEQAGIPVARYHLVDDFEGCKKFIDTVGFPVIVKPDNGVGASHTYKLDNEQELKDYLATRDPSVPVIMEEFIRGEIHSYDAILDSHSEPVFETGNITPIAIMDIVNNEDNAVFHIMKQLQDDVRAAGRAAAKAFGVHSRFVHFEFFRLTEDQPIGKKGQVVALEVNMRPCGGFAPDMMNFANSTDVYKIYADMIAYDSTLKTTGEKQYCVFVGRRDRRTYRISGEDLARKYADHMRMQVRMPDALADAMGNQVYIAVFPDEAGLQQFYSDALTFAD